MPTYAYDRVKTSKTTKTKTSEYDEESARRNIRTFYEDIDLPGGYSYSQVETLKMIDLYYASKYKSGVYDEIGQRKLFFNVVKPACDIATKFIDLDTKDINLLPLNGDDEFRVWIIQRKLSQYLEESDFGKLLNEISFKLPKYGTVVIKKDSLGEWQTLSIENLRLDPASETLEKSSFVYELHSMSKSDVMKMKAWNTEELFSRGPETTFLIYECYDQTVNGWHRSIYGDLFSTTNKNGLNRAVESEINEENDYYGSCLLYEDEVAKLPYRELHWEKVPGRWLGYGFVEYLEENQIATNEAENLERKGLKFTSLKLWQTRDENVGGSNVLSDTVNGQIIKVDSEITQIDMAERNLPAFNNTRTNWNSNLERKTFTTDITTGANLPSRTPLGVANLQASLATSYFELKREVYGLFVKELITDDVIPDFEKDTDKEHILTFFASDPEFERIDNMFVKRYLDDAVLDYAMKTGYFPSQNDKERVRQEIKNQLAQKKNRYLTVEKSAYRNAEYIVRVNITGESVDSGAKSQVAQLALQILGTNPAIVQNPFTRRIFFSILSMGGLNPIDLGLVGGEEIPQPQAPAPEQQIAQGGSVSVPQAQPGVPSTTSQQL